MKKEILRLDDKPRVISKKIENIDSKTQTIINNLLETLRTSERPGVGLAAPQIGENVRIVVIESEGYEKENGEMADIIPKLVLINPEITKYSKDKVVIEEGCLSVPDLLGEVERPSKIKMTALNEKGEKICINTGGFLARVIQHEVDHLDGILFIDLVKKGNLRKITEFKSEEL